MYVVVVVIVVLNVKVQEADNAFVDVAWQRRRGLTDAQCFSGTRFLKLVFSSHLYKSNCITIFTLLQIGKYIIVDLTICCLFC